MPIKNRNLILIGHNPDEDVYQDAKTGEIFIYKGKTSEAYKNFLIRSGSGSRFKPNAQDRINAERKYMESDERSEDFNKDDDELINSIERDVSYKLGLKDLHITKIRESDNIKVMEFHSPDGDGQVVLKSNGDLMLPDNKIIKNYKSSRHFKKVSDAQDLDKSIDDLYIKGHSDASIALKLNTKIPRVEERTAYLQANGIKGGFNKIGESPLNKKELKTYNRLVSKGWSSSRRSTKRTKRNSRLGEVY